MNLLSWEKQSHQISLNDTCKSGFFNKQSKLINWKIIADCILTSQRARLWKVKFDKESFLCVLFFVVVVVVGSAHQECNLKLKLDMKK